MSAPTQPGRILRLAAALKEAGADAFFAANKISLRYLSDFSEDAHERFLTLAVNSDGRVCLICPALSEQQARRAGLQDVRCWSDGENPLAHFEHLADEWGLRTGILAVDDSMSARQLLAMQSALPAALFKPGQPILGGLMRRKDPAELDAMRQVARIADRAYPVALRSIRPGITEREVSKALADAMSALGGNPTFSIVGSGPNGAEPHHESDETPIEEGHPLVMDFGCELAGYQSDITRCAACGTSCADAKQIYRIVFEAHLAGRAAIRPGIEAEEVDRAARAVIDRAGYGEFFVHRTGHGIGMRGHEEPYIVNGNKEVLEIGDCFSVEPGIYLPGRFGIRIENIVTVTHGGHESLNEEPAAELHEI